MTDACMPPPPVVRRRAATAFVLVVAFLDVMALGIVIPVLPELVRQMSGSGAMAGLWNGLFVALWGAMQFLFSPIIGSLSDRFGRRPVLLISIGGLALDFLLMAVAPNLFWLALARIISGITSSSFTTAYAYLADITRPDERARGFGLIGAAFSGGFVVGPLIGGVLGELSLRAPFWAAAGLCGATFLFGLFVLPESLAPERRMAFDWRRANPVGSLTLLRSSPGLARLATVNFLLYFAHHVFSAVFVLYAGDRYGWTAFEVGLVLALWGGLDMAVQAGLVGPAVRRLGDRRVMVLGLAIGAVSMVMMGLAGTGGAFVVAVMVSGLWGLAMPTIQSLMTRRVSETEQGQLQGANNSVVSIAAVVSPLVFGTVYSLSAGPDPLLPGIGSAFMLGGLILAAAAIMGVARDDNGDRAAG